MRRGSGVRWLMGVLPGVAVLVSVGLVFGASAPASAAPAYPQPEGRCVDLTKALGKPLCQKVTAILLRDEKRSPDEVAVAVVPTTGKTSIETWSTGLFNDWGVGKKGANNGVLLVVALDDHRVRLETGRGVSKRLSDARAATIITTVITPRFAEGAYAAGILAGLDEVRRVLGHGVAGDARLSALASSAPNTPSTPIIHAGTPAGQVDTAVNVSSGGFESTSPGFWDEHPVTGIMAMLLAAGVVMGLLALFSRDRVHTTTYPIETGRHSTGFGGRSSRARRRSSSHSDMMLWSAASTSVDSGDTSSNNSGFGGFSSGDSSFGGSSSSDSSFGGGSSDGGGSSGGW